MKAALLFFGIGLLILSSSCDDTKLYSAVKTVESGQWAYDSAFSFTFEVEDTINIYDMPLSIRNRKDYEYSNLWLFVSFHYPDGTAYTDTVECPLAYPDGRWIGTSGPGYIDNLILFKRDFQFPAPGTYRITIAHGMRDNRLEGIKNIGLRVQRAL